MNRCEKRRRDCYGHGAGTQTLHLVGMMQKKKLFLFLLACFIVAGWGQASATAVVSAHVPELYAGKLHKKNLSSNETQSLTAYRLPSGHIQSRTDRSYDDKNNGIADKIAGECNLSVNIFIVLSVLVCCYGVACRKQSMKREGRKSQAGIKNVE